MCTYTRYLQQLSTETEAGERFTTGLKTAGVGEGRVTAERVHDSWSFYVTWWKGSENGPWDSCGALWIYLRPLFVHNHICWQLFIWRVQRFLQYMSYFFKNTWAIYILSWYVTLSVRLFSLGATRTKFGNKPGAADTRLQLPFIYLNFPFFFLFIIPVQFLLIFTFSFDLFQTYRKVQIIM